MEPFNSLSEPGRLAQMSMVLSMKRLPFKSRALRAHRSDDFTAVIPAPFGAIGILVREESLVGLTCFPAQTAPLSPADSVSENVVRQVGCYLEQPDFRFDLPLTLNGTDFQRRVWEAIAAIPLGETRTYGELARQLGSAPRAVGQACASNHIALVIPCHRVVGAKGLGGFFHDAEGGPYTRTKRWLLAHEGLRLAA